MKKTIVGISLIASMCNPVTDDMNQNTLSDHTEVPLSEHQHYTPEQIAQSGVYITIDDGPSPYTHEIIQTLQEQGHKATFFRVGQHTNAINNITCLVQEALSQGNLIENHSFNHHNFSTMELAAAKADILAMNKKLENLGVPAPQYFRYPYGAEVMMRDRTEMNNFLDSLGYKPSVPRTVDTRDRDPSVSKKNMIRKLKNLKPGDIILLHEKKRTASVTLPVIDSMIKAKKLIALTLDQHPDIKNIKK